MSLNRMLPSCELILPPLPQRTSCGCGVDTGPPSPGATDGGGGVIHGDDGEEVVAVEDAESMFFRLLGIGDGAMIKLGSK